MDRKTGENELAVDADEDAETVTYRLNDGRHWTDGRDQAAAPIENPEAEVEDVPHG